MGYRLCGIVFNMLPRCVTVLTMLQKLRGTCSKTVIPGSAASSDLGASIQMNVPERGLPPQGMQPPIPDADQCKPDWASRPSERRKGGKSLWDPRGGEWRYLPGDRWRNPHWDYNPHDNPNSPWQNIPIGNLPPRKKADDA